MDKGMKHVGTISKPGGLRTGIKRIFPMTQQLIIYALRNRIESGPVRCYYGDLIVVYRGREIARWDHPERIIRL